MQGKEADKAKATAKKLAGAAAKKTVAKRYKTKFHRPKTLRLLRNPKYARKSVPKTNPLDQYAILKYPLTTESAMKKIEDNNTLVFIVDTRANKRQITDAVRRMYEIKTAKVNTLIRCAPLDSQGATAAHRRLAAAAASAPSKASCRMREAVRRLSRLWPLVCQGWPARLSLLTAAWGALAHLPRRSRPAAGWPSSRHGIRPLTRPAPASLRSQARRPEEGVRAVDYRLRCARRRQQDRHHLNSARTPV